jgi:hypothetical protein
VLRTGELAGFGKRWWQWWEDIQPGGHIHDESGSTSSRPADIDWAPLCKPGASGVHSVLVGLVWWKQWMIAADESWLHAVADVTWVLEGSSHSCRKSFCSSKPNPLTCTYKGA